MLTNIMFVTVCARLAAMRLPGPAGAERPCSAYRRAG